LGNVFTREIFHAKASSRKEKEAKDFPFSVKNKRVLRLLIMLVVDIKFTQGQTNQRDYAAKIMPFLDEKWMRCPLGRGRQVSSRGERC
jgi:hypothetical protein